MAYSRATSPPRYAEPGAKRKCTMCARMAALNSTLCPSHRYHEARKLKASAESAASREPKAPGGEGGAAA